MPLLVGLRETILPSDTVTPPVEPPPVVTFPPGTPAVYKAPVSNNIRVVAYVYTAAGGFYGSYDLTSRAMEITSSRGRSSRTQTGVDPASLSITFDDTDGFLDPENTQSALHNRFLPGRRVYIYVDNLYEGAYRPLASGTVETVERSWGPLGAYSTTVVSCTDQAAELQTAVPAKGTVLPAELPGPRINRLANLKTKAGRLWTPRPAPGITGYQLDRGTKMLGQVVCDGQASLWEYMTQAAYSDEGIVYFSGSGGLTFRQGVTLATRPLMVVMGTGAGQVEVAPDLSYRISSDDVVTDVSFTTADGAWTASAGPDLTVAAESTGTATQLFDQVQVAAKARREYRLGSNPQRAVESVTLDVMASYGDTSGASPARLAQNVSIYDRVRLHRDVKYGSPLVRDYHVLAISHNVAAHAGWTTTLRLAAAEPARSYWVLGRSDLGFFTGLWW